MTKNEYAQEMQHLAARMGRDWTSDLEEQVRLWFTSLQAYPILQFRTACRKIAETEDFFPKSVSKILKMAGGLPMLSFEEQTASLGQCSDCLSMGFIKLQGKLERRDGQYLLNQDVAHGGSLNEFLVRCDCGFGDARKTAFPRMPTFAKLFGDAGKPMWNTPESMEHTRTVVNRWMAKFPRDSQEDALQRTRSMLHAREEERLGHQREDDDLPF